MNPESQIPIILAAAQEKKCERPEVLDLRGMASFCDYFVILSGTNHPQVQAITDAVMKELRKNAVRPLHLEGYEVAEWVLVDLGSVIVHVFLDDKRGFYDLAGLWRDAKRVPVEEGAV